MSVNINADTTNGLVLTSDTSGELKLQSAGTDIATVDSSGITMASGKTLPASALTGALPALDGSSLTGVSSYADSDALSLFNASGSAPVYACRAFLNITTDTFTIRASGNISSVTDGGTGRATVNFTTNMPDANYTVCGCGSEQSGIAASDNISFAPKVLSTGSFPFTTTDATGNSYQDCYQVCISVFR